MEAKTKRKRGTEQTGKVAKKLYIPVEDVKKLTIMLEGHIDKMDKEEYKVYCRVVDLLEGGNYDTKSYRKSKKVH